MINQRPNDQQKASPLLPMMERVARHIELHAEEQMTLASLAKFAGVSPSYLHKSFKKVFGISPKAFQDAVRVQILKRCLKQGAQVSAAIYEAGFGSNSRIYEHEARKLGLSPGRYQRGGENESLHYAFAETSLGKVLMAASQKGICCVHFGDSEATLLEALHQEFPKAELRASNNQRSPELADWIEALNQHIEAATPLPELPLDLRGTAFQKLVWSFLSTIPKGQTCSYQQLAKAIGKPGASRAVGSACGANRIGLLIPCHRVLRGDGSLGGYRWGLERKRKLLALEQNSKNANKAQSESPTK